MEKSMIVTTIEECMRYETLIPNLREILEEIQHIEHYAVGCYKTPYGFYMIQKGTTNPEEQGCYETHEKYIDLQVMVEGSELMFWSDRKSLSVKEPYNESKDLTLYEGRGEGIEIKQGMCYFMFPEDGHMACTHVVQPREYTKLVYKIQI